MARPADRSAPGASAGQRGVVRGGVGGGTIFGGEHHLFGRSRRRSGRRPESRNRHPHTVVDLEAGRAARLRRRVARVGSLGLIGGPLADDPAARGPVQQRLRAVCRDGSWRIHADVVSSGDRRPGFAAVAIRKADRPAQFWHAGRRSGQLEAGADAQCLWLSPIAANRAPGNTAVHEHAGGSIARAGGRVPRDGRAIAGGQVSSPLGGQYELREMAGGHEKLGFDGAGGSKQCDASRRPITNSPRFNWLRGIDVEVSVGEANSWLMPKWSCRSKCGRCRLTVAGAFGCRSTWAFGNRQ